MSLRHCIFEDGKIREATLGEWAAFMECAERRVAWTQIGDARVSTVFLPYDWNAPLRLFETMVFADKLLELDQSQWRYNTLDEAKRGHAVVIEKVREFRPTSKVETQEFNTGEIPEKDKGRHFDILQEMKRLERRRRHE